MPIFQRIIEPKIKGKLFKKKVVIIYGARQVGKTTLAKSILEQFGRDGKYLNCEMQSVQDGLEIIEAEKIKSFLGNYKIVVLDEAQNIPNIGKKLKVMVDTYPDIQIIATGSSSFELADKISEPLTGRVFKFHLYPLSVGEIRQNFDQPALMSKLENILRFGSYPEVLALPESDAIERLNEIASNYLYKDVLQFEGVRKSIIIKNLLQLLALQAGQEVSFQEIAVKLGISRLTVQRYVDILEKSFVLFTLRAFSRNKRKEISKSVKIFFLDNGIRNSLIQNFNPLNIRNDVGSLWENFCVSERQKSNNEAGRLVNTYFWRTYDQKEVDYVEEFGGKLNGYEFKWNDKNKPLKAGARHFSLEYGPVEKIDRSNFSSFF